MDQLGKGKKVYGLIHADLSVDGNLVYHAGEARPLDFDDSGFGYWLFDLGVALAHYFADYENPKPMMQDVLVEGYQETTPLSEVHLEYLEWFTAARYAQLIAFYQGSAIHDPRNQEEALKQIDHYAKHLKKHMKKIV